MGNTSGRLLQTGLFPRADSDPSLLAKKKKTQHKTYKYIIVR